MIEEIHWLTYIMIILASYRFTHLIVFDKITEFIRKPFLKDKTYQDDDGHLKHKEIPTSKFGYLLNCYWCAGVWSAIFMALGYLYIPQIALPIIFIFSIAGAQAILETFVGVGVKLVDFLKSSSN